MTYYQNNRLQPSRELTAFRQNIKALRELTGLSEEEFGNRVGVHRSAVNRWEHGNTQPTLDRLLRICYEYQISADKLLGIPRDWRKIK